MNDEGMNIPIVELGSLFRRCESSPSAELAARRKLSQAFEESGVAYIRLDDYEPGIVGKIVNQALEATERLFSISEEEKRNAVYVKNRPGITRGFIARGGESGAKGIVEEKEAFSYSYDWTGGTAEPSNGLEEYNVWPGCQLHSRKCLEEYLEFVGQVMLTVAKAIGSTGTDTDIDEGMKISLMRCFHYFPSCAAEKRTGSVAHTDWTYATLIAQRQAALQIWYRDAWRLVAPVENTVVINCGDFLSLVTAGRMKSPLHRVILREDAHRYSLVYFQYPGFRAAVPPIQGAKRGYLESLSLFKDQSEHANGEAKRNESESFGELIMKKWTEVQRKKDE